MKKTVLIVAGETSGDIHAAALVDSLKKINPELLFFGIGGKRMEESGVKLVERMEKLSVIGVWEVLPKLGEIHSAYKKILARINETPPDMAVLVDYPGFNLALAKALKKKGVRVVYYITPQVWAWGMFRIKTIKKYVDKALVILKFEEGLLGKHGIDATFVGHPLLDRLEKSRPLEKTSLGLKSDKFTIALLPGSRISEVKNTLPVMLKTAEIILKKKDVQFVFLENSSVEAGIYSGILQKSSVPLVRIKDDAYGCLSVSDFVFVSSGTATLECAIMERPMVITYKTSLLTAVLFRLFAKTRFIGLVNIIAGRKIAPEILQYDARPENLARGILAVISSKEKMEEQIRGLREVKRKLGAPGASSRAARIIADFIT